MDIFGFSQIQFLSIVSSIFFLLIVFELIRKEKIKLQYSLLWIMMGILFFVFSIWNKALELVSTLLGIAYQPTAFILILLMAIVMILIQYSIVISRLSEDNKNLVQELGMLKMELKELEKKMEGKEPQSD